MKFHGLALAIVAVGVAVCGASWAADDAATAKPSAPSSSASSASALQPIAPGETSKLRTTSFAPTAYFNQNCARCHGENGSYYSEDFGKDKDDAALRQIIDEMAHGPGQAPLAPAELDVLTAWHRALRDKKPFVALVKAEKTGDVWRLNGEISPGATLQINGKTAKVDGTTWTHDVNTDALKLRAQKGDTITELDASAAAFAP